MSVGVISGLRRELDCLGAVGDLLTYSGVGPEKAAEGARQLAAEGARALVSFGVAGGLAPDVAAGSLVLATAVIDGGATIATDADWRDDLKAHLAVDLPVALGPLVGVDRMVPSAEAKRRLHADTGALACDMESHAVARVARELGLPFMVIRAISDPVWQGVPKWVLKCLTPDGGVNGKALAWALAKRPWALPTLLRLGGDSKRAFGALRGVARLTGPGLGFGFGG